MQPTPSARSTVRAILAEVEGVLAAGPHPEKASRDAEALVLLACRVERQAANRAWLIAHDNEIVAPEIVDRVRALAKRRHAGEPMQYITGEAEFYGLTFRVNPSVLIPRPETEHLVEKVLEWAPRFPLPRIVDVGTGSGAIAVALAHKLRAAQITATEISASAMAVARENAERNGLADHIRFLEGDLLAPVGSEQFEMVVSNPPYVPGSDRAILDVEVRAYEPEQALFAGEDGLAVYRRLIPAAWEALVVGGLVVLEIGFGQELAIGALLATSRFTEIEFTLDLQGIPRVASARRPPL